MGDFALSDLAAVEITSARGALRYTGECIDGVGYDVRKGGGFVKVINIPKSAAAALVEAHCVFTGEVPVHQVEGNRHVLVNKLFVVLAHEGAWGTFRWLDEFREARGARHTSLRDLPPPDGAVALTNCDGVYGLWMWRVSP